MANVIYKKHKKKHRENNANSVNNNKFHDNNTWNQSHLVNSIDNGYFEAMSVLDNTNRVTVYVEGYEDIAFWRNVFDKFTTPNRKFQIMTPARADLAKGKKVVMGFANKAGKNLLLCVDSDFDYLFPNESLQAQTVNNSPFIIQTYAYAIENLQCLPQSLHTIAVKATKTDIEIFDFDSFFLNYSKTIYPVFLWYAWAAKTNQPDIFSLSDFRNTVRINFLEIADNGATTIEWLERQVEKRLHILKTRFSQNIPLVKELQTELIQKGVTPETTHFYMQGHTLLDHVVKIALSSVCERLRKMMLTQLDHSRTSGSISQRNQVSYYNNSLVELDVLLSDNTAYMSSSFFQKIETKINQALKEC